MNKLSNILIIISLYAFSWAIDITDGCELPDSETTGYLHLTADGSVLYNPLKIWVGGNLM